MTTPTTKPTTNTAPTKKRDGATFDLVAEEERTNPETGEVTRGLRNLGRVFVRSNGTGGVVYLRGANGQPDTQLKLIRPRAKHVKPATAAPAQTA
jgi:hypothetical protein